MPRDRPTRGRTIAIIFGASEYPCFPALEHSAAFSVSATAFAAYLRSSLGLRDEDILPLFDDPRQPGEQVRAMRDFIEEGGTLPPQDVIFYYCGHGAYLNEDEYVLALRCTDAAAKSATTFKIPYLVEVIADLTHEERNLVILDACYSGAALGDFLRMSEGRETATVADEVFRGVADASTPDQEGCGGAILFCAAGPRKWAKAPLDAQHTMFTGAILETLAEGDPKSGASLSLKRLASLVEGRIKRAYGTAAVPPQIHVPVQGGGDLLEGPYFPNAAAGPGVAAADHPEPTSERVRGPSAPPPSKPSASKLWWLLPVLAIAAGLGAAATVLVVESPAPAGTIYSKSRPFFEAAVRKAALEPDEALFERLKLPDSFVGRRLGLLSFTSFEGSLDDRDWWGLIQPGDLPQQPFAPPRPVGPVGPVEKPFIAVSGIKSKNYAPASIPPGRALSTMTADRVATIFDVSGMKKIHLRYNARSDTNPQIAAVHNCGSFLAVLFRHDGGPWIAAMHICGTSERDPASKAFQEGFASVNLPPGAKTLELAFAFDVQGVTEPLVDRMFLVDDMTLFGEY